MSSVDILSVFTDIIDKDIIPALKEADNYARAAVIERMIEDTDEFVPYDTGATSRSVKPLPHNRGFQYTTPYASYALDPKTSTGKMKEYQKDVHPKAQGTPFIASKEEHGEEWEKLYAKEVLDHLRKQHFRFT